MRQLVDPDEQKLRALVLINVVLRRAVSKSRRRSIQPGHHVLPFVVGPVQLARHIPPEIVQQRRLQFRKRPPQQQRIRPRMVPSLQHRFHQQRFRFSRPSRPAKQSVLRVRLVKLVLLRKRLIPQLHPQPFHITNFSAAPPSHPCITQNLSAPQRRPRSAPHLSRSTVSHRLKSSPRLACVIAPHRLQSVAQAFVPVRTSHSVRCGFSHFHVNPAHTISKHPPPLDCGSEATALPSNLTSLTPSLEDPPRPRSAPFRVPHPLLAKGALQHLHLNTYYSSVRIFSPA